MNRLFNRALLPLVLAAAGCASKATLDAQYDASLQRWQGATRAELEASWGKPMLAQAGTDASVLTWIVRKDLDDRDVRGSAPGVVVTHASTGGGGSAGVGSLGTAVVSQGSLAPTAVPITCTTRFTLKDGHVVSWTFDGLGCGAPY